MGQGRRSVPRGLCAHEHEDDGVDIRRERRSHDRVKDKKLERKDEQLAHAAMRAADEVLAASMHVPGQSPGAAKAHVGGGGTHVTVWIAMESDRERREVDEWLWSRGVAVRAALARALNRKRTPTVTLRWLGRGLSAEEQGGMSHEN